MVAAATMPPRAIVREAKPLEAPPANEVDLRSEEPESVPEPSPALDLPLPAPAETTSTPEPTAPVAAIPLPTMPHLAEADTASGDLGADLEGLLDGLDDLFDAPAEDAPSGATDNGMGDLLDSLDDLF